MHDLSNATCFGVFIRFHKNLLNDLWDIDDQYANDSKEEVMMEDGGILPEALQDLDEEPHEFVEDVRDSLKMKWDKSVVYSNVPIPIHKQDLLLLFLEALTSLQIQPLNLWIKLSCYQKLLRPFRGLKPSSSDVTTARTS